MSGHSKWSTIKRKKAVVDAKRGKVFTKVIREITVAARLGGGEPDTNPRLRLALDKAKAVNMPADNIERAIKKGTGGLENVNYEELTYEGYGPQGVAVLLNVVTDNKNRTVGEIRRTFVKSGGNLGESGCVAWMFDKKGYFHFEPGVEQERLMEVALEAGADDVAESSDGGYDVYISPDSYETARAAFQAGGFAWSVAEVTMIPQTTVALEGKEAEKMLKLMEALEDNDDVQDVYANFDVSDEDFEQMAG